MKRTPLKRTGSLKRTAFKPKKKYDGEWQAARKSVLTRSYGRCEARWDGCRMYAEHVHHIKRRSQGGGNEPSNLLACCFSCHESIHRNPAKASEKGHLFLNKG
jgi:5-methylcytosine-specific restriction endonuclease McrA